MSFRSGSRATGPGSWGVGGGAAAMVFVVLPLIHIRTLIFACAEHNVHEYR